MTPSTSTRNRRLPAQAFLLTGLTAVLLRAAAAQAGESPAIDIRNAAEPSGLSPAQTQLQRLGSTNPGERADAVMKLRHLGMRGEAAAAVPALVAMLGSEDRFPRGLLWVSSLSPLTQACTDDCTFGGEAAETLARTGTRSDALLVVLHDGNWRRRADAIRALGGLKDTRATEALLAALGRESEAWQARGNAALALGALGDERAVAPLAAALRARETPLRAAAASALGRLGAEAGLQPLLTAVRDPDARVRTAAAGGLGSFRKPGATTALIAALRDPDRAVREVAAGALRRAEDPEAAEALIAALKDEYANVRINAAGALGRLRNPAAFDLLLASLGDSEASVRAAAASALGEFGDPRARTALVRMVSQDDLDEIQLLRGLQALAKLGDEGARRALKEYEQHRPDWRAWWKQNRSQLPGTTESGR